MQQPNQNYCLANRSLQHSQKFFLYLLTTVESMLLLLQAYVTFEDCQYGEIQRWSLVTTFIICCHIYYHSYSLYLLRKRFSDYAQELNQLDINNSTDEPYDIESKLGYHLLQNHRSLPLALMLSIATSQVAVMMFALILYQQTYKMILNPVPAFAGNCEDFLLNFAFIVFLVQFGTFVAFYVATLVIFSFFPFIVIFLMVYLGFCLYKRLRAIKAARNFPIKLVQDLQGVKECAICIQEYQVDDQIRELPCDGKHHFHKECIDEWLKVQIVCPLCRKGFLN